MRRTRLWNGIPMYYIENILSPSIAQHLNVKELAKSHLYMILKEKIGLTIARGEMYMEAVPADPDVAEILKMQMFEPLILRQLYYWFPAGDPFDCQLLYAARLFQVQSGLGCEVLLNLWDPRNGGIHAGKKYL